MAEIDIAQGIIENQSEITEWLDRPASCVTFGEAGLLTSNEGVVLTLEDGSEYQITIVQSRPGEGEEW